MNRVLLKQILMFNDDNRPTHGQIAKLYKVANEYQKESHNLFLKSKYRQRAQITDYALFFEFVSEVVLNGKEVTTFEEIENILNSTTRKESIKNSGDSKSNYLRVFDNVVLYQKGETAPILCKKISDIDSNAKILAVENGETFLNIASTMSKFGFDEYIYLGGFSNLLTKEFLKSRDVVFFLDYDIEAIRIYDSFECKSKSFFRHPNIEYYFKNYGNQKLYLKQRATFVKEHDELQWLIDLIDKYSVVVEQEIVE